MKEVGLLLGALALAGVLALTLWLGYQKQEDVYPPGHQNPAVRPDGAG